MNCGWWGVGNGVGFTGGDAREAALEAAFGVSSFALP